MSDLLHHYTDINTLSLILKYKTIRFNRLDRVDDITESDSFKVLRLAEFFFVSCWTYDKNESIPQWNMYTKDMVGVRISFPKRFFNYSLLKVPKKYKAMQSGEIISPLPFEKIFTDAYMILPYVIDEHHFAREVEYLEDYKEKKNEGINIKLESNGRFKAKIQDPTGLVTMKSPDWSFQKEFRFVLFIFPSLPLPPDGPFSKEFSNKMPDFMAQKLYNGEGPPIDYIDVDINPDILNKVTVTTGPLCTDGDIIIVESLMSKYAPEGNISRSKFEGTIRNPKRR